MPITTPKGRLIMGIIFFILFTLAEIALVVLTFTKFRKKVTWRRNRAIIRTAEVGLLLGMILIPTVNMKWRFFGELEQNGITYGLQKARKLDLPHVRLPWSKLE